MFPKFYSTRMSQGVITDHLYDVRIIQSRNEAGHNIQLQGLSHHGLSFI